MVKNNYFSHNGDFNYASWMRTNNLRGTGGEILYSGYDSASSAINSWLNSPKHKAIMFEADSTLIGVGYAEGKWTMVFN